MLSKTNDDIAGKYLKLLSIFKARNIVFHTSSVFVFNLKMFISLWNHCLCWSHSSHCVVTKAKFGPWLGKKAWFLSL